MRCEGQSSEAGLLKDPSLDLNSHTQKILIRLLNYGKIQAEFLLLVPQYCQCPSLYKKRNRKLKRRRQIFVRISTKRCCNPLWCQWSRTLHILHPNLTLKMVVFRRWEDNLVQRGGTWIRMLWRNWRKSLWGWWVKEEKCLLAVLWKGQKDFP